MNFLKNKSKTAKLLMLLAAVLLIGIAACAGYLNDYYPADPDAAAVFPGSVQMRVCENGNLVWEPEEAVSGLIFYPGGKVEHTAYVPLMNALASRDILCVLVEMPLRLAVMDMDAAEGIREEFPQIESWYIGGHSLGGSMAASYLSENTAAFAGLILLGSYSTADLSETALSVLSVYGSEDQVLNREKYEQNKRNLPDAFQELVIDGGCHAYFGAYGPQEGDGTPEITNEAQIICSAEAIAAMIRAEETAGP
ncbi:MAG: alpha/beta hydrolase [Oscillospiraceae bacterium]|nr:alpha/beta hydrolase [Oscillospiraceae bacterium]MBQ7129452.1 alpha/beta hydrolase [Oscillospiraceae bacterium]